MRLDSLELTNFGVYRETVKVDFSIYGDNELILIIGENRDEAGSDSNGSGKTNFFNGISWVLFGKTPYSTGGNEIIHYGCNSVNGVLRLIGNDNDKIVIKRQRKEKGGHEVQWWINDEDQTLRTMQQTQQSLLHYLGILENNTEYYGDFLNTTYFSMDAVKAFAGKGSTSKERMDLISRFLNLEILDRCTSRSKVLSNNFKGSIDSLGGQIEFLTNKLDPTYDRSETEREITRLTSFNREKKKEIKELRKSLENLSALNTLTEQLEDKEASLERLKEFKTTTITNYDSRIADLQKQQKTLENLQSEIENKESTQSTIDNDAILAKINKFDTYLVQGREKLTTLKLERQKLDLQLAKNLACPSCKAELMLSDGKLVKLDILILTKQLETVNTDGDKVAQQLEKKEKEYSDLKDDYRDYGFVEVELKQLYKQVTDVQAIPTKLKTLKTEHEEQIKKFVEQERSLAREKAAIELKIAKFGDLDVSLYNDIKESISALENKIEADRDEISRLNSIIDNNEKDLVSLQGLNKQLKETLISKANYDFWAKGFPAIRSWMIESFLPSFEEQTNSFLNQLEVGMRVRFDTQKEKKSGKGEMKSQFDLGIIDNNNNKRELETYSGGESKRIGVCVGFALRELTLNKGYNAFNFLLMDEVIDSLDETGIGEFFNLLHNISGMKFLITHSTDLKNRFTNVIKVTKEEGVASISQN